MRRLSVFRKSQADKSSSEPADPTQTNLSHFLELQKVNYLKAVAQGQAKQWTVVMGNEAGDLDSLASSIAYAWYATNAKRTLTIPLIRTPRDDFALRAENQHALALAGIDPARDLLCMDDAPSSPSDKFALVDHNALAPRYAAACPDARVVAVIDHHEDEGLYTDTADPRIITVPTGSCASLVARLLADAYPDSSGTPPELATLLLAAILIDTGGLKPGGKATAADRDAAAFLAPLSSVWTPPSPTRSAFRGTAGAPPPLQDAPALQRLTAELQAKKFSLAHLGTRDLLRRDYKEYAWASARVGLASVPVGFKAWLAQDAELWAGAEAWMAERGLDVLGVLTSFRDERALGKSGKGKQKRQQLWVVRADADAQLAPRLWKGLEDSKELKLKKKDLKQYVGPAGAEAAASKRARAYKQGNVDATRKATAPIARAIVEGKAQD
ncbi:DHH phosphoesterase [Dentipellis sp. KUC8613]|nr:DHH phosphoesterase [Dentipellis sp. KUC8613]